MTKFAAIRNSIIGLILFFALFLTASSIHAQEAGYLKITTAKGVIEGKSADPAHANWIPLTGAQIADLDLEGALAREFSAASVSEVVVTRRGEKPAPPTTPASGKSTAPDNSVKSPRDVATGQASGKRQYSPIRITKEWGAASPLLRALQTGATTIPEVEIFLPANVGTTKAGHYKLTEVLISSIQPVAEGSKAPKLEIVSFAYQKIEWTK